MCGFSGISDADGLAGRGKAPRPVATLGLPPLCLGSREYDGYSFSSPRLPAYGQVRRCVAGMRVEPRFRGLMARTVLLVYTLFELLGSWLRVYHWLAVVVFVPPSV